MQPNDLHLSSSAGRALLRALAQSLHANPAVQGNSNGYREGTEGMSAEPKVRFTKSTRGEQQ
jgi:hypothetical protein